MLIEVIGPEASCHRCKKALEIVKEAVAELKIDAEVVKVDMLNSTVFSRFGIIFSPALAINGRLRSDGRIPSREEVVRMIKEEVEK